MKLMHKKLAGLRKTPAAATGAQAAGAVAVGAIAIGAFAVGAMAIGALAIGRLAIGRVQVRRLEIDDLVVRRIRVLEELAAPPTTDVRMTGEPTPAAGSTADAVPIAQAVPGRT